MLAPFQDHLQFQQGLFLQSIIPCTGFFQLLLNQRG